jgi:peptidoglycan/LPS O-acetylase OafA/YrhL
MSEGGSYRLASLDGLRGMAAVVVVLHHTALTVPALVAASADPAGNAGWIWWLTNTPVHLLWGGAEAVYVFFVLSGFVLTLPFAVGRTAAWGSYYLTRLLRLYLPVWGALVFAIVLWAALGRSGGTGSSWVNSHADPPRGSSVIGDLTLWSPSVLNSSLWSLKWEVAFSLLLPVFVAVAAVCRKWGGWTLAIPPLLVTAGMLARSDALTYMPIFLMGSLLAFRVSSPSRATLPQSAPVSLMFGAAAVALLTMGWWSPVRGPAGTALAVVGAALLLLLFLRSPRVGRVAGHRVAQTLGRWSFSLYLVHAPVVITVAGALTLPAVVFTPLVLGLSLSCAALFYRVVELPALTFARWQGGRTLRKVRVAPAAQVIRPWSGTQGATVNPD